RQALAHLDRHAVFAAVPPPRRAAATDFADARRGRAARRTAAVAPSHHIAARIRNSDLELLAGPEPVAAPVRERLGDDVQQLPGASDVRRHDAAYVENHRGVGVVRTLHRTARS